MSISGGTKRVTWPLIATALSITTYINYPELLDTNNLGWDRELVRLILGGASYFAAAWLCGRLIGVALQRTTPGKRKAPRLVQEMIVVGLFLVALVATIMLVMGQSMSGAMASSGILLAVIGIALRNVIGDVFSGIAVGLEAPYRIGDWIELNGVVRGKVVEIGWRTTRLLARDETYMILPNSKIARQQVTNYSAPRRKYRAQVEICLGHNIPVTEAKVLLSNAVAASPIVLQDPAPDVRVVSHDRSAICYAVRFWVPSFAEEADCRDAVFCSIDDALRTSDYPMPTGNDECLAQYKVSNKSSLGRSLRSVGI
ncbi:mechanosensitive ion channel family protein (plasmid) [Phyllobacterium sp. A18/5-2]|uniref:mechanosensitive ion channel family protein n=1 Tax=Phyllobacterium sp. A18/5-2 TaxID=2978392 RepID=UPI0021C9021F|nr:mechanosensitive ion channel family protein [Phyllobacterium sp. A18/5-2]UXN66122.1 mechanosensitive ion channel family protein [Phyllobacterium sp. A18/5-2]